jgi:hypothetical protein
MPCQKLPTPSSPTWQVPCPTGPKPKRSAAGAAQALPLVSALSAMAALAAAAVALA